MLLAPEAPALSQAMHTSTKSPIETLALIVAEVLACDN